MCNENEKLNEKIYHINERLINKVEKLEQRIESLQEYISNTLTPTKETNVLNGKVTWRSVHGDLIEHNKQRIETLEAVDPIGKINWIYESILPYQGFAGFIQDFRDTKEVVRKLLTSLIAGHGFLGGYIGSRHIQDRVGEFEELLSELSVPTESTTDTPDPTHPCSLCGKQRKHTKLVPLCLYCIEAGGTESVYLGDDNDRSYEEEDPQPYTNLMCPKCSNMIDVPIGEVIKRTKATVAAKLKIWLDENYSPYIRALVEELEGKG